MKREHIAKKERLVPTRVGMIPRAMHNYANRLTCPHTRGDDPSDTTKRERMINLSPHAWG